MRDVLGSWPQWMSDWGFVGQRFGMPFLETVGCLLDGFGLVEPDPSWMDPSGEFASGELCKSSYNRMFTSIFGRTCGPVPRAFRSKGPIAAEGSECTVQVPCFGTHGRESDGGALLPLPKTTVANSETHFVRSARSGASLPDCPPFGLAFFGSHFSVSTC